MKFFVFLFSLILIKSSLWADLIQVTVDLPALDHGENSQIFNPPSAAEFTAWIEPSIPDENLNPQIGEYEMEFPITWKMPNLEILSIGSVITVYSGFEGFYGFTIGNLHMIDIEDERWFWLPEYVGLYAAYLQGNSSVAPDDSLHWFFDSQLNENLLSASYGYIHGMTNEGNFHYQDTEIPIYKFGPIEVPEPSSTILIILGLILIKCAKINPKNS